MKITGEQDFRYSLLFIVICLALISCEWEEEKPSITFHKFVDEEARNHFHRIFDPDQFDKYDFKELVKHASEQQNLIKTLTGRTFATPNEKNVSSFYQDSIWHIDRSCEKTIDGILKVKSHLFRLHWNDTLGNRVGDLVLDVGTCFSDSIRNIFLLPTSYFEKHALVGNRRNRIYRTVLAGTGILDEPEPEYFFNLDGAPYSVLNAGMAKLAPSLISEIDSIVGPSYTIHGENHKSAKLKDSTQLQRFLTHLGNEYLNGWVKFEKNVGATRDWCDTLPEHLYATDLMRHVFSYNNWDNPELRITNYTSFTITQFSGVWSNSEHLSVNRPYTLDMRFYPKKQNIEASISLFARNYPNKIEKYTTQQEAGEVFTELGQRELFIGPNKPWINGFAIIFKEHGLDMNSYKNLPDSTKDQTLRSLIFHENFELVSGAKMVENELETRWYFRGHFGEGKDIILDIKPVQLDISARVIASYLPENYEGPKLKSRSRLYSLGLLGEDQ